MSSISRKGLPAAALFSAVMMMSSLVNAAPPPPGADGCAGAPGAPSERRGPPSDRKGPPIEALTAELGLTAKQSEAFDTLLRERHQAMQAMRQRAEEQRDAAMQASDERILKVLSPMQFGKFKAWEASHRPPHGPGGPEGGRRPPPEGEGRPDPREG